MSAVRRVGAHLARASLAVAVALVAWLAFPEGAGDVPRHLEVGAVANADIITVTSGNTTSGIDAALARTGTISGTVTGNPQFEIVAVAAAGSAPTTPAGLLMAK